MNSEEISRTPHLFQPYFQQYESWRDQGLDVAQNLLNKNSNAIIMTMDFTSYFYSLDISLERFEDILLELDASEEESRIHQFVYDVLKKYSICIDRENTCLPIGFFPSNILSNWYLNEFDDAIIERWNPAYYARYVDDVIIIDKVENNGIIHKKVKEGSLDKDFVMEYFMCDCNAIKERKCRTDRGLLKKDNDKEGEYFVSSKVLHDEVGEIRVNKSKVSVFYFDKHHSDALIECFRNDISKNKSEFRLLPEDEHVLDNDDYSEIYKLQSTDSVNKLRSVKNVSVDKYALSKFLGKYLRISPLIKSRKEIRFEKELKKIFDKKTVLENYTIWERILEVLVINEREKTVTDFLLIIAEAILSIQTDECNVYDLQKSLLKTLYATICRVFSLNWKTDFSRSVAELNKALEKKHIKFLLFKDSYDDLKTRCEYYCYLRMCDKNAVSLLLDSLIDGLFDENKTQNVNLTDFKSCLEICRIDSIRTNEYRYYPYIINPQEIEFTIAAMGMKEDKESSLSERTEEVNDLFVRLNGFEPGGIINTQVCEVKEADNLCKIEALKVGHTYKTNCRIAVANTRMYEKDFISVLEGRPNRTYQRYATVAKLIRDALENKADILVLPEAFLPFEWLPTIMRTCAQNGLAIVTGIEITQIAEKPEIIYELSPRQVEEAVCELFEKRGYKATLTRQTRDGGKDLIILDHSLLGKLVFYVECKRFSKGRPVGVGLVRQFYGSIAADRVTAGILITSSYFSGPAFSFARKVEAQLTLKDYAALIKDVNRI